MAYYGESPYEGSYYAPSPHAGTERLAPGAGYDAFSSSSSQHLASSQPSQPFEPSGAYAAFDSDSFNSPMVPSKSLIRDGRLKTKLMGVGSDGGFLTSPLVLGKSHMAPLGGDIQIASPAPTAMGRGDSFGSASSLPQSGMEFSGGMGMGISGVSELQAGLEMGDYGSANLKIFGMPKTPSSRTRTTSAGGELGYLPYPEHLPTTTLGRGKNNLRDVSSSHVDQYVDQRFRSPPPQAGIPVAPATAHSRKPSTNRKNLTVKTLNKAKSCSALNQPIPSSFEPLTPVSSHGPNFFNIPGVPFNSPVDEDQQQQQQSTEPAIMPFTFSDLYNFGLAVDSVDDIDPRKSPLQFVNDLMRSPQHPQSYTDDAEFNLLHQLPTPYLAHGSGFSSPSSTYLSDPSPDLAQNRAPSHLSSNPMLVAPAMEQQYSIPFSNGPPPPSPSRQRCATYAPHGQRQPPPAPRDHHLDPNHLIGGPSTSMQRGASIPPYVAPRFSYPTRYGSDQGQSHTTAHSAQQQQLVAGPYSNQGWANDQVVPATYGLPTPEAQLQSLFQPTTGGQQQLQQQQQQYPEATKYEQNLEAFEDMYDHYSQAAAGFPTPGKRGRDDDFNPDVRYHLDLGLDGDDAPRKRLRTVASAPMLGSPRRMRPGPKPKVTKSPQEACQSVFSANLSPPPVPFRRGSSPFASDGGSPNYGSDDEDNGVSSVTRDTIQSFYEGVPGHTASNGQKIPKRYMCLIEGCERLFPRKSAIESHIQTHLEDKPFVCPQPDCDAAFVRQHDLRRHERIHSGNKPFPCPCGKGFARGDALARHRARGICTGSVVPRRI
ncbi:hypothetical protein RQP46_000631 [Phenoliferia psychrophenolica]